MNPFGSLLICVAGWMNRNQQEVIAYLFVIRLATREVQIAGIVPEPNERWMNQMARNLTDSWDGFLRSSRYLIHDRSTVFTEQWLRR